MSEGEELNTAFNRTIAKVAELRAGFDHCAIACDAPPYLRKELLPSYKAQREATPPQVVEQLDRTKRRLVADGLCLWEVRGFEADDILATACYQLSTTPERGHITVASGDKDLLQLVSGHVSVVSPLSGTLMRRDQVIEKFGVAPEDMGDLLALMGDSSDNVPGIPGVGPKKAAKLLADWGSLEGVLTHHSDIPGVLGAAVRDHGPAARLARKVVTLRTDVPIDVEELFQKREVQKLETRTYEFTQAEDEGDGIDDEVLAPVKTPGPAPTVAEVEASMRRPESMAITKASPAQMVEAVPFEHGLEPRSLAGAYKFAEGIHQSRLYPHLSTPEAVWAVMVRGREMGLGAMTALDTIVMIKGKPALSAHLIIARAKQHPECEYFQLVSSSETEAEWVTRRKGNPEPTRLKYTIDQAIKAGIGNQGNWLTRRAEMVRKTAGVQLARIEFPECAIGMFAIEELE
jgi:5'-3' exonuclease